MRFFIDRLRSDRKRVWWVVLAAVFGAELLLMFALPWVVPAGAPRWIESTLDAVVLTLVLSPLLWWAVLRPLIEMGRLRDRFLQELFARIEIERRWMAQELHDSVGQSLTLLISGLRSAHESVPLPDVAERCHVLQDLAQNTLKEVKRLTLGLRPSLLDDLGLAPAIEQIARDIQEAGRVGVAVDVTSINEGRYDVNLETAVFRIVQEALTNIVKHSRARQASVTVRQRGSVIEIVVEDDGCGFDDKDFDQSSGSSGRLGVIGMRERAHLLGGETRITLRPSGGTRVSATLPIGERKL